MFSVSKELGFIQRKRNKSSMVFNPLEYREENKEYQIKRSKFKEDNKLTGIKNFKEMQNR